MCQTALFGERDHAALVREMVSDGNGTAVDMVASDPVVESHKMTTVLFVDDEEALRRAARRWLNRSGLRVLTAGNVRAAKECFRAQAIDGAFIDIWLKDGTGVELFAWIREHYPYTARHVVLLSGDIEQAPLADSGAGSDDIPVLPKPFDLVALDRYVARWTSGTSSSAEDRPGHTSY